MERTRRNIGLAGLAALVAGLSGCGAMIAAIGAQRGNPGLYTLGQGIAQIEVAQAGRNQVNVINGQPQEQYNGPPREGIDYIYAWDNEKQTYITIWLKK